MAEFTYAEVHAERYRLSLAWLRQIVAETVLEVGASDGFTQHLKEQFKIVENTDFDLRWAKRWPEYEGRFDLVVCMEIIEHIGEPLRAASTIEEIATFTEGGVRNTLDGMFQALKPGGRLFLTTPNGSSLENVRKALAGYTPIQYSLHTREYGVHDMRRLIEGAGFKIDQFFCQNCYSKFESKGQIAEKTMLSQMLGRRYTSVVNGGTMFVLATKPLTSDPQKQ